jgi:CPA1 family monovalent cation:H+ antiporter
MALALSLPVTLPGRSQVITLIFSTVLVSLIVQGLSLPWLVKRLQLSQASPTQRYIENLQMKLLASKAAQRELKNLFEAGGLPKLIYEEIFANYQARIASSEDELREIYNQRIANQPDNVAERAYLDKLRRRLYVAEKVAINDAVRKGLLSEKVAQNYIKELNERLLSVQDD